MNPTYIRLLFPTNTDSKNNTSTQNMNSLKVLQSINLRQNNLSSVQLLRTVPSIAGEAKPRLIITPPSSSTFNFNKSFISQKTNNYKHISSDTETFSASSLSVINASKQNSNDEQIILTTNKADQYSSITQSPTPSSNVKRNFSPCSQRTEETPKQRVKKSKIEEIDGKSGKRRFWREDETITFINLWSNYYPKLTTGGSRHSPIYNSMANDLNEILVDRHLTGADVKLKIGNLTTEYRKKRKEQGRTGASPCKWPYYDLIDKLLGERPYMDDSLLTDSIKLEQGKSSEITDSSSTEDLNSTQISKQADDTVDLIENPDNLCGTTEEAVTDVRKSDDTPQDVQKQNKNIGSKKKRSSETKINLLKELVGQLESTSQSVAQSEVKIIELLEKQTRLQQQSLDNEKEFLNVFKNIVNSMPASQ